MQNTLIQGVTEDRFFIGSNRKIKISLAETYLQEVPKGKESK